MLSIFLYGIAGLVVFTGLFLMYNIYIIYDRLSNEYRDLHYVDDVDD
jgi:hypothetical protein